MKKYYREETPYLETKVYNTSGSLVTPTSVEVILLDPNLKVIQATASMTQVASTTGLYYYAGWTIPATALAGKYKWLAVVTDSSIITKAEGEFEVVDYGTT